jgi:uncharacterized protein (DUF433 family)
MNGSTLDIFLEHFPDVTKEQAQALLDWEANRLRSEFGQEYSA